MITDEEIVKIYEWADKYGINNGRRSKSIHGNINYESWMKGIPKNRDKILNIERLRLDNENIKELPKELFSLPNLKELDIRGCPITEIPLEIKMIKSLALNNLTLLNDINTFENLTKLYLEEEYIDEEKYPNIKDYPVKNLSLKIFNLSNLTVLSISGFNKIQKLPKEIGYLKNLIELDLRECDELEYLPKEIGDLKNLTVLNFEYCHSIKELPQEIGNLSNLKVLDLRGTSLEKLPDTLSNLVNLEMFNGEPYIKFNQNKKTLTEKTLIDIQPKETALQVGRNILSSYDEYQMLPLHQNYNYKEFMEGLNVETNLKFYQNQNQNKKILREKTMTDTDTTSNKKTFSTWKIGSLDFPHKNILLKGVPGTGKSRAIENIIEKKLELELENHKENILRINIHSASSNADLMQGIGISSKSGQIEYKEKQGLILNIIEKATFHPQQPFVLILEEIQENSLNELIGDLIYLIAEDKRTKNTMVDGGQYDYQELVEKILEQNPKTAYVEIPYLVDESTKYRKMIMPDNLYIFCTSNYRDDKKVIEDNLLRRFEVLEMYPKHHVVYADYQNFFKKLNENILEVLKDEIHPDRFLIGHSNWIIKEDKEKDIDTQQNFYRAFLKIVVEFKDVKEIEFEDFKKITKDIVLPDGIELAEWATYKELISDIQIKAGYDFLD